MIFDITKIIDKAVFCDYHYKKVYTCIIKLAIHGQMVYDTAINFYHAQHEHNARANTFKETS